MTTIEVEKVCCQFCKRILEEEEISNLILKEEINTEKDIWFVNSLIVMVTESISEEAYKTDYFFSLNSMLGIFKIDFERTAHVIMAFERYISELHERKVDTDHHYLMVKLALLYFKKYYKIEN